MELWNFLVITLLTGSVLSEISNDLDVDEIKKSVQDIPGLENSTLPSVEDVEKVIRDKCDKNGGAEAFNKLEAQKDALQECIQNNINVTVIQDEVEEAKQTGSMDEVFARYCKKIPDIMLCVKRVTDAAEECLEGKEKDNLVIVLNVTESLLDFICFKDGDRIAMFIAEGGVECLDERKDALQSCFNETISGHAPSDLKVDSLPLLLFETQECQTMNELQECAVGELEKCREHTPANVIDALFNFARRVTPCGKEQKKERALGVSAESGSMANWVSYGVLVISIVVPFL